MKKNDLLADVRVELAKKSKQRIEAETADRWCARAIVAYENYAKARGSGREAEAQSWLVQASDYEHEAVEHAGEAGTADVVRAAIKAARRRVQVPGMFHDARAVRSIRSVFRQ